MSRQIQRLVRSTGLRFVNDKLKLFGSYDRSMTTVKVYRVTKVISVDEDLTRKNVIVVKSKVIV